MFKRCALDCSWSVGRIAQKTCAPERRVLVLVSQLEAILLVQIAQFHIAAGRPQQEALLLARRLGYHIVVSSLSRLIFYLILSVCHLHAHILLDKCMICRPHSDLRASERPPQITSGRLLVRPRTRQRDSVISRPCAASHHFNHFVRPTVVPQSRVREKLTKRRGAIAALRAVS